MIIRRTANAGVLIEIDATRILLDGVCGLINPYLATEKTVKDELLLYPPDVIAFTHKHLDHYDESFVKDYSSKLLGRVFLPEKADEIRINSVDIIAVPTRHIGKNDVLHTSFIIKGSKTVWFMGDASPLELRSLCGQQKPDVIIVPFAYAMSESAWRQTKDIGAKHIILVHLPDEALDEYGICSAVDSLTKGDNCLIKPALNDVINLY